MFLFQMPCLPETVIRASDLTFLKLAFCGMKGGAKRGSFTDEDIEAYKYTFTPNGR